MHAFESFDGWIQFSETWTTAPIDQDCSQTLSLAEGLNYEYISIYYECLCVGECGELCACIGLARAVGGAVRTAVAGPTGEFQQLAVSRELACLGINIWASFKMVHPQTKQLRSRKKPGVGLSGEG